MNDISNVRNENAERKITDYNISSLSLSLSLLDYINMKIKLKSLFFNYYSLFEKYLFLLSV